MRFLRYGNLGRMHVILNGEPFAEVDCFKYLWSQVAADGGCERDMLHGINGGYRVWGALKVCWAIEALYEVEAWGMRSGERTKVNEIF